MKYKVQLTKDAEIDLEEIYEAIASYHSTNKAAQLLDEMDETLSKLSTFPERGSYPKELLQWGIKEYRQVFCEKYRLIYRIIEQTVYVQLIVDGRRDMETLLIRRLTQ